ncbi:IS110 family transposase [Thermoanaerobacteraceae bacterium SP2]|nr:IS110 family transposase [Thermoanaerobacteraceae bacterium SP2]
MLAILSQLEPLLEQVKEYEREIERLFKLHSDSKLFDSLPGAGLRLASRLLAEWGDYREHFLNASVVQALAETSPVLYQSGKYCFAKRRKSCVKPFRNALHQFAFIKQYGGFILFLISKIFSLPIDIEGLSIYSIFIILNTSP